MQVVIDPKVFQKVLSYMINVSPSSGSREISAIVRKLTKLEQDKADFCFLMTNELKEQYARFLTCRTNKNEVVLVISFIRHLINRTAFKITWFTPKGSNQKPFIPVDKCQMDDLDVHLIMILVDRCDAKTRTQIDPIVTLLLDCTSNGNGGSLENRCLSDKRFRDSIEEKLRRSVQIVCAEDDRAAILIIDPNAMMNSQQHDARFEDQCALWLLSREQVVHCERELLGEEIDILLRKDNVFYIGECKLIHGENAVEQQEKALQQIKRRISKGSEVHRNTVWRGLIFCNKPFSQDIRDKALDIKKEFKSRDINVDFEFVEVTMPSGWQNQPNWRLLNNHFKTQVLPIIEDDGGENLPPPPAIDGV